MASPAFVSGTALKRDQLLGGVGASLSREVRLAREMHSGPRSALRSGVATLAQAEADRMRTFSIGLNRETRDTLTGLGTTRVQEAAAAMFPGIRTSETLRSASLLGGTRLTKDMQRMLERGGALGEVSKAMERYNAIQADRMRTFSIGLNRETRDTLTGLGTTRVQEAAAAMFPGIRTSETLRSASLLGGTRLTKDMQRMLERGGALGEVSKAMERYNAIQADRMRTFSIGLNRETRDTLTGLGTTRVQEAAAAMSQASGPARPFEAQACSEAPA